MNAKKAFELSKKSRESGINYQVAYVLERIGVSAREGHTSIPVSFNNIVLHEDDYKTLESMGYNCIRPTQKYIKPAGGDQVQTIWFEYGVISWDQK